MWIVRVPQCHGMDQRDVPPHQVAECVFRPVPGKLVEQFTVWNDLHSTVICPRLPKGDNFLLPESAKSGYTLASGSSSSASAAVAHRLGLVDNHIAVHCPGGIIQIEIREGFDILMTGSVTKVSEGVISPEIFG